MKTGEKVWYAIDVVHAPEAGEAVEYALMEAGALGTESLDEGSALMRASGYFHSLPEREMVREKIFESLRLYNLPTSSVREMSSREVADRDWLDEWKKGWQPVEVGRRFIIAPSWSHIAETPEQIIIRIEPGMAFGTGTHETTRLCLKAIEKYFKGGSFLDVGTGTGILAIAAAKLSPKSHIEACDTDAEAISIARENAEVNEVLEGIDFRVGTIDESTASFDFVCANLTADVIVPLLPALIGVSCERLVLSGILESQVEWVLASLREAGGSEVCEIAVDGEWVSIIA